VDWQRNDRLGRRNSNYDLLEQWREILRAIRSDTNADSYSHSNCVRKHDANSYSYSYSERDGHTYT
jgi:hypothetical protein